MNPKLVIQILTRALIIACVWGIPVSGFQTLQKLAREFKKPQIRTLAQMRPVPKKLWAPEPSFGAWMGPLPLVGDQQWQGSIDQGRLRVTFQDRLWFHPGTTKLTPEGIKTLEDLANAIHALPTESRSVSISIEAHSDSTPIIRMRKQYPTPWELSSARGIAVLHKLNTLGFASGRLSATGYGDSRPISSQPSLNRRMEFMVQFNPLSLGQTQVAQRSF